MPDGSNGFYVGYLPLPERHRRVLTVLVPALVFAVLVTGGAIALSQREPGDATWDSANLTTLTGILQVDPYPMLLTDEGVFLVVGMGKFGVHERVSPLSGARCSVNGWRLERDGRRMIELDAAEDAISVLETGVSTEPPQPAETQPVTLRGEIIDGKCFLGAMKPGDGKGHKACAILCIQGGLPPMFVYDDNGVARTALLIIEGSTEMPDWLLDLVAEPVIVKGTRLRLGDLVVINALPTDIQPASRAHP